MLSAPPFVVVTIKWPLLFLLNPYTSGTWTLNVKVSFDPAFVTVGYGGSTDQNPTSFTRGVGSSGDLNITGGDGTQYEGGGSSTDEGGSTSGGSSYWGGGGMGDAGGGSDVGGAGQAYGSGGGGGQHNGTNSSAGGAGKAGLVYVEEYK